MQQQQERNNQQHRKPQLVGELPQWNSRFRFSTQKQPGGNAEGTRKTPSSLGQPRRVPVGAAGAAAAHAGGNKAPGGGQPGPQGGSKAPAEPDRTPTLCLFERFESLSLHTTTPYTSTPKAAATAAAGSAAGTGVLIHGAVSQSDASSGGSTGTAAAAAAASGGDGAESAQQQHPRPARRSVAFGTPSVLTYTPGAADGAGGAGGGTPLWSNAGHTPYSLPGSDGHGASYGGCIRELDGEGADADELLGSCGSTSARTGGGSAGSSTCSGSAVRLELFTSIIHEVTGEEAEHTPFVGRGGPRAPVTPVAPPPAAAAAAAAGSAASRGVRDGGGDGTGALLRTTAAVLQGSAVSGGMGPQGPGAGTPAAPLLAAAGSPSSPSSFSGFGSGSGAARHGRRSSGTPTLFGAAKPCADGAAAGSSSSSGGGSGGSLRGLLAGTAMPPPRASSSAVTARMPVGGVTPHRAARQAGGDGLCSVSGAHRAAATTAALAGSDAGEAATISASSSSAGIGAAAASPVPHLLGLRLPAVTPKSKLRQPERVAVDTRPAVPQELKQLLGDRDAAAGAAAAGGGCGVAAQLGGCAGGEAPPLLGSCAALSPVRARKSIQAALDAGAQVLTPVRRSARKTRGGGQLLGPGAPPSELQAMLEATNYAYTPNAALKQ